MKTELKYLDDKALLGVVGGDLTFTRIGPEESANEDVAGQPTGAAEGSLAAFFNISTHMPLEDQALINSVGSTIVVDEC